MEIWWPFVSKKYIPSAKTYTEDLSNITFNYLCENSSNYVCHFWNHTSFFTTQLLCIFLTRLLHTFYKINPSKWKFSDFPLLRLKFTKFLVSFCKQVNFSSKFGSFPVSWEIILLYYFSWNFICYLFATAHIKIHQIPHVILGTKSQFHYSSELWRITLLYFFI